MVQADPTQTTTLRRQYGQRLRGILGRIMGAIREGFVTDDVLQLQNQQWEPEEQEPYTFPTSTDKVRAFMDWFRTQVQNGFLGVVSPESNVFIEAAYKQGVSHARQKLSVSAPEPNFELPPHESALNELYTRSYELLQDVSEDMSRSIRDTLVDGMAEGAHSSEIARRISDRVQKVGKHRATLISRTETINAYSEGSLTQFEEVDVEGVTLEAEVLTAQDNRVCAICHAVENMGVFPLSDFRQRTISHETLRENADKGGEEIPEGNWSPKPPIHPQCRCTLVPII